MSRFLQLIIQLLTNALTIFIGYLINQISSIDSIAKSGSSAKDIQIFWLIGLGVIAIAFINFVTSSSSENQSQSNSSIKGLALASIIPVALSLALYFGLKSGFLPLQYSKEIFYVVLVLVVAGALLPSLIMWREAKYKNKQQQTPTNATVNSQLSNALKQKLLEFVSDEVDLRRRNSLHNLVMIDLSMQEQPQQVGQPPRPVVIPDEKAQSIWMLPIQRVLTFFDKSHSKTAIEPTKKIIDVFREVNYKLLILGTPGSGKTTMLLNLAKELCAEARQNENEPVPVVFELSNWKDDKQSIADWLASEMKSKYTLAESITKEWLANYELLPLFDGLDELGLERQVLCVEAINQFIKENSQRHLVICCRTVEYQAGKLQLALNNAVCLEPLTGQQIEKYLKTVQRFSMWSIIRSDSNLQELANLPLFLTMIVIVYQGNSISSIQELFDAYIDYQFLQTLKTSVYTPGKEPSRQKSIYWLIWLAKTLKAESNTEFLIERMQPSCLREGWQKRLYSASVGLIMGFMFFLIGLNLGLNNGMISGLLFGLITGFLSNSNKKIETVELFQFSWVEGTRKKFIEGIITIMLFGVSLGLIGLLIYKLELSDALVLGFYGGLLRLMTVLIFGWKAKFIVKRKPNQEIWFSLRNSISIAGITCLLNLLILVAINQFSYSFIKFSTLYLGLTVSVLSGSMAVIQHFVLRLILWSNGDIPWNYARFLNYACERKFLQKVGGHYRFIHDLLREHFADLPLNKI